METKRKYTKYSDFSEERKARVRAYQKEWRDKNKDRRNAQERDRRSSPDSKHKEWQREYRKKNRLKHNEQVREYAKRNRPACRARFRRYQEKHRAKLYENWGCQQAIKRGCVVADRDKMVELYQQAIDLTKSSGVKWSVDHIICIGLKGPHRPENAQVMPMGVNQLKSGNPFWICPDGKFKDWRDVPVKYWPKPFAEIYDSVVSHSQNEKPFYSMTA